eukprot:TRINITY_DN1009_c0_g1_i2.p1 TRINITY_DN1009_c0_g1~~TRINITY_DN1009_c0_g1_i2.p1  ORF type:complete len:314 (-),score=28.89 TRINITY_DN1009_c0_g1_i2:31-972(-)
MVALPFPWMWPRRKRETLADFRADDMAASGEVGAAGIDPNRVNEAMAILAKFGELRNKGKQSEASTYLAGGATWLSIDGAKKCGRQEILDFWISQEGKGYQRKTIKPWAALPELCTDAEVRAERTIQAKSPAGLFCGVDIVQTATVGADNLIISIEHTRLPILPWEEGMESLRVLRRFAALRTEGRDDDASLCLAEDCKWSALNCVHIFERGDLPLESIGREAICRIWKEQARQGMTRSAQSDWTPVEDLCAFVGVYHRRSMEVVWRVEDTFARSILFVRGDLEILGHQVAVVRNGRIIEMKNNLNSVSGLEV